MDLTVIPINQRGKVPLEDFQLTFATNVAMKLFEAVTAAVPGKPFFSSSATKLPYLINV